MRERAVVVPEEALVPQGGKQFIVKAVRAAPSVAAPSEANGEAKPALVSQRLEAKLGARIAGKVEILEGLQPGDLVVTAGQARVMRADGLSLRVIDVDKPAGAANGAGGKGDAKPPAGAASAPRSAG
jgi:membrane fusion protein (multidrug efflux system)